jgi:plasmid stabilization system protein ParE
VKAKPVIPREQANRDVDDAVAYYLTEATEAVALGFIDALEQAYGTSLAIPPLDHRATPMNSTCRACALGR